MSSGDRRGVWIGVGGTVVLHALLIWLAPRLAPSFIAPGTDGENPYPSAEYEGRPFEIEFAPQAPADAPPEPDRFVEINPDAPVNPPDETPNFGAQDQQVAQPEPTPRGESDSPAMEAGKDDLEGVAIVQGTLTPPETIPAIPAAPPLQPTSSPEPSATSDPSEADGTARLEMNPLPGYETLVGDAPDAPGSTISNLPGTATERVDGTPEGATEGTLPRFGGLVRIDPRNPLPRPRLAPETVRPVEARPAPLIKNEFGTENIGAVAFDAKWNSYGEYLKRFIDTVQVRWEQIIRGSTWYPPPGTTVKVRFKMNAKGEIVEIVEVESTGGQATRSACVSAITDRSPYGAWSDDMVSVLGEEQEVTFTFYYR